MRRRTLLGIAAIGILATAGTGVLLKIRAPAPRVSSSLSPQHRSLMARVAEAVLDETLPQPGPQRALAISKHLERLEATVTGLQVTTREEIHMLLAVLANPLGRRLVFGLHEPWETAPVEHIQAALQGWRDSRLASLQQAYHALRDLTNASYFSDPASWPTLGYPGPRHLFDPGRRPGEGRE